ncbi:hypothetical protein HD_1151 [[Haemophilus] ducreyi 35000HP]|uniref:Uncharacterized protein n=1 Tax=Haemophilus ducreyi (strain 35000HP / ATCC 700724) TaxID=233412 RepID=Q7VM51_HAEDU|nr:hypothetical protein HD_1151 [[Haemophilus] ducreyi 35000HP]
MWGISQLIKVDGMYFLFIMRLDYSKSNFSLNIQ